MEKQDVLECQAFCYPVRQTRPSRSFPSPIRPDPSSLIVLFQTILASILLSFVPSKESVADHGSLTYLHLPFGIISSLLVSFASVVIATSVAKILPARPLSNKNRSRATNSTWQTCAQILEAYWTVGHIKQFLFTTSGFGIQFGIQKYTLQASSIFRTPIRNTRPSKHPPTCERQSNR